MSTKTEGASDLPFPSRWSGLGVAADDAALTASVEAVFLRCETRLGRYLAQMVRDRSLTEDLLQDTVAAALRSRAQLSTVANQEAWLFGIARNRALDALRRRRRFEAALVRFGARRRSSADSSELVALRDLLERTLTPEDRSLVILRYLHDFDASELAAMTGITPDAVRQRLSRARARLLAAADPDEKGASHVDA